MHSAVAAGPRWIISRREDLVWFQGSVVAGLALLAFFRLAPPLDASAYAIDHPAVVAVFLWGALFDGTHVWATYARSYGAPDPASRAGLPGPWSWSLLTVGPAIALLDALLGAVGLSAVGALFAWFLLAAWAWAYWHLVRQHYGFLMLYRRRAGESDPRGARLDSLLLWTGCLYPFFAFALSDAYPATGLPAVVPVSLAASLRPLVGLAFVVAFVAGAAVAVRGRFEPFASGPKHLLLAVVVVFHGLVFALLHNLLTILATLTIFHNLQYHRVVWQYERGLGRTPSGGLRPYLTLGVALGLGWYGARVLAVAAVEPGLARNVLLGLGWGIAFHHYLVDGRIWHVRRSAAVATALEGGAAS